MTDSTEAFIQAMRSAGLDPADTPTADGILHRMQDKQDKPGKKDLFYILFGDDLPAGMFGHWSRLPDGKRWQSKSDSILTAEERHQIRERIEHSRAASRAEKERIQAECRKWCTNAWNKAPEATNSHPYLVRKGVPSYGLRIYKNTLLIPVQDMGGEIHGLQFISPDGTKKFKSGTSKTGHFYGMGKAKGDTVCICEGYATGASIHMATGDPVLCALDAGNLKPVAESVKKKLPFLKIIICCDNDPVGISKGTEAARAVGGLVAIPAFDGGYHAKTGL